VCVAHQLSKRDDGDCVEVRQNIIKCRIKYQAELEGSRMGSSAMYNLSRVLYPLLGQHFVNSLNLVRVTHYLQWGTRIQNWGDPTRSLVGFTRRWPYKGISLSLPEPDGVVKRTGCQMLAVR